MSRADQVCCGLIAAFLATLIVSGCSPETSDVSQPSEKAPLERNARDDDAKSVSKPTGLPSVSPKPKSEDDSLVIHDIDSVQAHIEKLYGYKTPAEYLIIESRYYPHAIAAVSLPIGYDDNPNERYPLVIAFGGAGECARPPRQGALAWIEFYKTDEAVRALNDNHLEGSHFKGLATERELLEFNRSLQEHPYGGVILACPFSPPLTLGGRFEDENYEAFIVRELVTALKKHYRVRTNGIGIDGVSMGGARSMYYGFKYPEVFRSIGSIQAAVGPFQQIYENLAERNVELLKSRSIQLISSSKDPMQPSVHKMHNMLRSKQIPHRYSILTGPHDYVFNQGPGALALLIFHDRVLRSVARGPTRPAK